MDEHDLELIEIANNTPKEQWSTIKPNLANSIVAKEYLRSVKLKLALLNN